MDHHAAALALGEHLQAIGYDAAHLARRLGRVPERLTPASVAIAERRAGDDALGTAIRLWCLGLPVPVVHAGEALGGSPDTFAAARLIELSEDRMMAGLRITSALGRLHAHDFDRGGGLVADHVLGIGAASRTLSGITPRAPVERALDLGTGCGVQALGLAAHARQVVATDISERAAWAARVSAALNGIDHLEVRVGDGFAPVEGESFELIVSNPPFVVSPANELVFRDGGSEGDELSRQVVAGAIERLRPGGLACVLVNWIVRDGEEPDTVPRSWLAGVDARVLLLLHDTLDPVAYAQRWALPAGATPPGSEREVIGRWVDELERLRARSVAAGALVVERREGPGRIRPVRMRVRPDEGGAQVRRMLDAIGRFSGRDDPALVSAVPRLVPGHRLEQRLHRGPDRYVAGPATMRLDHSAGVVASVAPELLEALFLIDGHTSLVDIATDLAEARARPAAEILEGLLPLVLELYELGYIDLVDVA